MKILFVFLMLLMLSCSEKQVKETHASTAENTVKTNTNTHSEENYNALENWINFYQKQNPDFKIENFKPNEIQEISEQNTSTPAIFDKDFKNEYQPFLIYSPNRNQYLDIDSYNWEINADGNASFEADQEIILVDIKSKTKKRIAYFGPSYRIEDACWKNNETALLLGNSDDNVPFYIRMNFSTKKSQFFIYQDTIKTSVKFKYREFRLRKLGLKLH